MSRGKRPEDQETHARLLNWGAWASQGLGQRVGPEDAHAFEPVAADAECIERAILALKPGRPTLYRYAFLAYVRRWADASIEQELGVSRSMLDRIRRELYRWIEGFIAGRPCA